MQYKLYNDESECVHVMNILGRDNNIALIALTECTNGNAEDGNWKLWRISVFALLYFVRLACVFLSIIVCIALSVKIDQ